MKDLQAIIESKVANEGYTKTQIYNELGRQNSSFDYALKKMSFSIEEFDKMFKILNIEPNHFFEWSNFNTQNLVSEPMVEYRTIKKDTKNVSVGEVEFLREQIRELNSQIRSLTSAINNLTSK